MWQEPLSYATDNLCIGVPHPSLTHLRAPRKSSARRALYPADDKPNRLATVWLRFA